MPKFLKCTFVLEDGKTQEFPFPLSASFGEKKNFLQDENCSIRTWGGARLVKEEQAK